MMSWFASMQSLYFATICVCCGFIPVHATVDGELCSEQLTKCLPDCVDQAPSKSILNGGFGASGSDLDIPRENCRCDSKCAIFGDCCVDYFDHCVNETNPPVPATRFASFFRCISPFDPSILFGNVMAVAKCPPAWQNNEVRNNCENDTLMSSQKLLTLPVNGPDDYVFKNVYCAICHNVPLQEVQQWSLELWSCSRLLAGGNHDYNSCVGWRLTPPQMSKDPHRCYRNFIDTCPIDTLSEHSNIELCQNHTSVVFSVHVTNASDVIPYKNIYCKYCNTGTLLPTPGRRLQCNAQEISPTIDPFRSFTLLFDFTKNKVKSIRNGFFGPMEPESLGNCSSGQIYDPFMDICRNLGCPDFMRLQDGQCVLQSADADVFLQKAPSPNNNATYGCFQQQLLSSSNMSNSEKVQAKLFEDLQKDIIRICADFSVATLVSKYVGDLISDGKFSTLCNATTILLVVSSESCPQICSGFKLNDVELNEIREGKGTVHVNISGYVYEQKDFVHETKYDLFGISKNRTSMVKESLLTLCSPFISSGCPVLTLDRGEFQVSGIGAEAVFLHIASGTTFLSKDVWQLPDGTLQMCSFLPQIDMGVSLYPEWIETLSIISFVGSICSLVMLLLTLVTYLLFPVLRNQPGKIVMNFTVALILAQIVLIVGRSPVPWLCALRGTILHFAWMAVFTWMSVLAGDLAFTMNLNTHSLHTARDQPHDFKIFRYGVFAWGVPGIFVAVCFVVSRLLTDHSSMWIEYGGSNCWIVDPSHSLFFFGIPLGALLFINCLLCVFMIYTVIANTVRLASVVQITKVKASILLCLKLVVINGVTWTLFFVANLCDVILIWYISVLVNSLQGVFIGLSFLLNKIVISLWKKQIRGCYRRRAVRVNRIRPLPLAPVR